MVHGKQKGNAYERKIYKFLRDTFPNAEVKRSLGSGNTDETSDIHFILNNVHYVIECKKGSKKYCSKNNIKKYWVKLISRCKDSETPILIWKEDYAEDLVLFDFFGNFPHSLGIPFMIPAIITLNDWIMIKQRTKQ